MNINLKSIFTKERIKDYGMIMLGDILIAIAVTVFFEPEGLVTGGVSGIAIIVSEVSKILINFNIPLWATTLILNIPLFLLSFKILGKNFLGKTIFSTAFFTLALSIAEHIPVFETDLIISAIMGSVLSGIGAGLVFKCRATTGGTDLAASIIHKYFKHVSIPKILFAIDSVILAVGFIVFGANPTFHAILAVYITSKVTDTVLEGFDFAKAAFIISDKSEEIGQKIMEETERGATFLNAQGVYTGKEKKVLLVIMNTKEIVITKDLVKRIDPAAFIFVSDVREVLGEGFQIMQ